MNATLMQKVERGDHLTDEELVQAHAHIKRMAHDLMIMGPIFHLAFVECNRRAADLALYIQARGL